MNRLIAVAAVGCLTSVTLASTHDLAKAQPGTNVELPTTAGPVSVTVRTVDETRGGYVVIGDRDDGLGQMIVAGRGEVLAGYLVGAGGTWKIERGADGPRFVTAPNDFDCGVSDDIDWTIGRGGDNPVQAGACPPEGVFHDVLIVYPQEVEDLWGGEAATFAEIDAIMALSNLALANSAASPRFRLALAWKVDIDNGIGLGSLIDPNDGFGDEVHILRDLVAADQVTMLFSGGGGVAAGIWELDPAQESRAFNRSGILSFPYVFPHELGHNMGCCHAVGDGGGCGVGLLFDYSNGWRWFGDSGTQFRTIMAYSPGVRVGFFSNPKVNVDGQPTGTPDADNALTMILSQDLVANFRCSASAMCGDLDDPAARADCNGNGYPDGCDIGSGLSTDANLNGVPDECECLGDLDGSGDVGFDDLLQLLAAWGGCPGCPEDLTGDDTVGFDDILALLAAWGGC